MRFSKPTIYLSTGLAIFVLICGGVFWFYNRSYHDPKVLGVENVIKMDVPEWYLDPLVVNQGDNFLSVTPLAGEKVRVEHVGEKNIYHDAYPNTDVAHTEYSFKIKEEMIFKQPGHPIKFQYRIGNVDKYYIEKDKGNIIFYDKELYSEQASAKELSRVFTIPAPFIEDSQHYRLFDVVSMVIEKDLLIISVNEDYFKDAKYPITLDPTVEINVLNVYSHPQTGENWEVEFVTKGQADLKIIPNDQATINDDEFISLTCLPAGASAKEGNGEEKTPEILAGDIIYYPNWQCDGTGKVVHRTLKAGKHTLRFEFGDPSNLENLITAWAYNDSEDSWYDNAWSYRLKLTIANAKVDADLTNFPVYVNLDDLPDDTFWARVKTACADVRITNSGGTFELPREIVACDKGTKTGEMHFQADALANSTDTDFYIYYGNASAAAPAANATYGSQNVWTNGYNGVWHLNETSGGASAIKDSTSNHNDGTDSGNVTLGATGNISNAADFAGGYIAATAPALSGTKVFTIGSWVKADSFPNAYPVIISHSDWDGSTFLTSPNKAGVQTGGSWTPGTSIVDTTGWHYVAATYNTTYVTLYVDGGVSGGYNYSTAIAATSAIRMGLTTGGSYAFDGKIDESRISSVARSADWIKTEYNNQNSPATFYSPDAEETAPVPDTSKSQIGAVGGGAKMIVNTELSPSNLSSGLVGHWTFNGDDTTWATATTGTTNDISGNNNTGTMTGMSRSTSPVAGKLGQALKFDGSNDYVGVNYDLARSNSTVSFWVKTTVSSMGILIWTKPAFLNGSYADRSFFINSSGQVMLYVFSNTGPCSNSNNFLSGGPNIADNKYHHITGVWNATNKWLYVDGVLVDSNNVGIGAADPMPYLNIGWGWPVSCYAPTYPYFNGSIDDVRIYNRALTPTEVGELYKITSRKVEFQP